MGNGKTPWDLACDILRCHARPGEAPEQTINRLWTTGTEELRPVIWRGSVDTYFEQWSAERIAGLPGNGGHVEAPPGETDDPPVVVRWRMRDYRIDGRVGRGQPAAQPGVVRHAVLILDIGNVAGDI